MTGFTARDVIDQRGKTVVITGANTGIGYAAAQVLAHQGARVLLACRSSNKAEQAIGRIKKSCADADVNHVVLDLGDLASIRACATQLQSEPRIDILINNAGVMVPPYTLTTDGFELQFGTNHLGPFAFTSLLLEKLSQSASARVVNTSSIVHHAGRMHFADINAEQDYNASARYSMSKLANLLFSYELQRRLRAANIATLSVACHPGIASTELSRHLPGALNALTRLAQPLLNTAAAGAWPTLLAATAPQVQGGDYCGPGKRFGAAGPAMKVRSSRASHDKQQAARLWDLSIEMTQIDPAL